MQREVVARDGVRLHVREWSGAAAARPTGTILIVHGIGEHAGRHETVATALAAHGWRVVGHDQRGHGRSGGERGRLRRGDDLLVDLASVVDAVRADDPHGRLVLLGHSLGGLVAARFVAGALEVPPPPWHREVDALVLSSPALAIDMNLGQRALLAVLERLAPDLAVGNGLQPAWLSRDPGVVARYVADPQVHDRIAPRLARFMVDAIAEVQRLAPRWSVPTLLLYAGSDRCVRPEGSAAFAAAAPPAVVEARAFPALFHEIFNEPERAEVLSALTPWLDKLPAPPTEATP